MEIKYEEVQVKGRKTKTRNQKYKCKHCRKIYTPVKKDICKRNCRSCDRTVYRRKQWKSVRASTEKKRNCQLCYY